MSFVDILRFFSSSTLTWLLKIRSTLRVPLVSRSFEGCRQLRYIMWIATSQKRIELSAYPTLKGKEAQIPSNKAFESGKTNTTSIPMLDITRSAHTVGITTVSLPIGRREAFSNWNWFFFYNWNWNCPFVLYECDTHASPGGVYVT